MSQEEAMAKVTQVQAKYADHLMKKQHVVGVAVGMAKQQGKVTTDLALVVMVDQKMPLDALKPDDHIPSELDGVRVDVQEVGKLTAF